MKTNKFQVMPPLSDPEYEELKADIKKRGVMIPVEYDEMGNILDGYHRVKICHDLGITEWPRLVRQGMTEDEKEEHAIILNFARRQLTDIQRKDIWLKLRQQGKTLQKIADLDGTVSIGTVHGALKDVFSFENVPTTITDTKGRKQPTKKPRKKKTVYISTEIAKKAESLPQQQKEDVLSGNQNFMEAKREAKLEEISKTVNLPDAKYRIIYADPPWSYSNTQPDYQTDPKDYYPTMILKDICDLSINNITLDDAVLFLWVTSPILEESFQVIKAWGFQYKSSFVWDKVKHNMGHYNSVRHEFLLICTKGSCTPDVRKLFDSVQSIERTEHSRKPEKFREIIETLYIYGKRLELFPRGKKDGWDGYGYEA